jgi:hypothetical protein
MLYPYKIFPVWSTLTRISLPVGNPAHPKTSPLAAEHNFPSLSVRLAKSPLAEITFLP